jgi:hypothetical protein
MNVSSSKLARDESPRQQVSPLVVALVAALLIAFIVWCGWSAFAGPPTGKLPPPPTEEINFLHQKATESQGDFTRLTPDDQTKIQKITHGFGIAAIASEWRKSMKNK